MIPFVFQPEPIQAQEGSILVPANVESKAELFAFLQVALSLPNYFGNNWDALEECLAPESPGQSKIMLVHQDIPLGKHPSEQRVYLEILAQAGRKSDRFQIVFPASYRTQIERSLNV